MGPEPRRCLGMAWAPVGRSPSHEDVLAACWWVFARETRTLKHPPSSSEESSGGVNGNTEHCCHPAGPRPGLHSPRHAVCHSTLVEVSFLNLLCMNGHTGTVGRGLSEGRKVRGLRWITAHRASSHPWWNRQAISFLITALFILMPNSLNRHNKTHGENSFLPSDITMDQ